MYDLFIDPPEPLVPRRLRFEVGERVQHDGTVLIALEDREAMRAIREAVGSGARAIAVTLLHAHINPLHEQRIAALLGDLAPDVAVSCSSEVAPEIREYEGTSTTVANAYVMPLMGNYLAELEKEICAVGIPGRFFVMLSSGGIASAETARRFPVRLVESGPAAGAVAAARCAPGRRAACALLRHGWHHGEGLHYRKWRTARRPSVRNRARSAAAVPSPRLNSLVHSRIHLLVEHAARENQHHQVACRECGNEAELSHGRLPEGWWLTVTKEEMAASPGKPTCSNCLRPDLIKVENRKLYED
jgi:hypothetical protein